MNILDLAKKTKQIKAKKQKEKEEIYYDRTQRVLGEASRLQDQIAELIAPLEEEFTVVFESSSKWRTRRRLPYKPDDEEDTDLLYHWAIGKPTDPLLFITISGTINGLGHLKVETEGALSLSVMGGESGNKEIYKNLYAVGKLPNEKFNLQQVKNDIAEYISDYL